MRETVSGLRADRSQSLLLSGNKLKLAVFGANVSGGCSMTSAEGAIKVEWAESKRIAQAAQEQFEAMAANFIAGYSALPLVGTPEQVVEGSSACLMRAWTE